MTALKLHTSTTLDIYSASSKTELELPLVSEGISAGFPSPALDFVDLSIDLNKHLIKHPTSTFYGRVKGQSMKDEGINDGDLLVIDKSLEPVEGKIAVWGIGRQHAKRLKAINVNTAFDFTQLNDSWVKKNLAIVGLRLKHDLQGIPTLGMGILQSKKTIATTRSFEKNYIEFEQLKERVTTFAVSCAEKLRKQKSCCNSFMLFIHTNGNRHDLPQYSRNIVVKLPFPTNSSIELAKFANQALGRIFIKGFHYKKAGVIVMDFSPESQKQLKIFENSNTKHVPLMEAIDKINTSYGQQKIRLASQDLKRVWKMKQEKLSPRYTTNLNEIITIHV